MHSCSTEDVLLAATTISLGDPQPANEKQKNSVSEWEVGIRQIRGEQILRNFTAVP